MQYHETREEGSKRCRQPVEEHGHEHQDLIVQELVKVTSWNSQSVPPLNGLNT